MSDFESVYFPQPDGRVKVALGPSQEERDRRLIRFVSTWDGRGIRGSGNGALLGLSDFIGGISRVGEFRVTPNRFVGLVRADGSTVVRPDPDPGFSVLTGATTATESLYFIFNRIFAVNPQKHEADPEEPVYKVAQLYQRYREELMLLDGDIRRTHHDIHDEIKWDIMTKEGFERGLDFVYGVHPDSTLYTRIQEESNVMYFRRVKRQLQALQRQSTALS